jgi:hypothetical protein
MNARGITATSGRHGRSFEGAIDIHHAITPRYNTMKATDMRRPDANQTAQTAKAAKAIAKTKRASDQGKFE